MKRRALLFIAAIALLSLIAYPGCGGRLPVVKKSGKSITFTFPSSENPPSAPQAPQTTTQPAATAPAQGADEVYVEPEPFDDNPQAYTTVQPEPVPEPTPPPEPVPPPDTAPCDT